MEYDEIDYKTKLEKLLEVFSMSTKLAETLRVSRVTLVNWRSNPSSISINNRFNIDVLYCKHFVIPDWDQPNQTFEPGLLPDDMPHNQKMFMPFLRQLSYGTIEIESGISQEDFDHAIDADKLPRNMSVKMFHEAFNTFMTLQELWKAIIERNETFTISEASIKALHNSFMRGVHADAGVYSKKIRVMGHLEDFATTWPEDIPEEVNRWVYRHKDTSTIEDLAKAHAYFIAIHPFGDGNGRVGRALIMAQCLNARLTPPVFNAQNKAMYYATMEHAMAHGRHIPLMRLISEASSIKK